MLLYDCLIPALLVAATTVEANVQKHPNGTAHAASIAVPTNVPSGVPSAPVNKGFCGFAFEARSFFEYMGTPNKPNKLSINLINAVAGRTKTAPIIRAGGTSLDAAFYNRSQEQAIRIPSDQHGQGIPRNMTVGPSYFDAFKSLPTGRYILDIPLAVESENRSIQFAKDGYSKIGAKNIYALEVGNEPNLYPVKHRPKGWTVGDYMKQWSNWSTAISKALGLPPNSKIYEGFTLVSMTKRILKGNGVEKGWTIEDAWSHGLSDAADRIKAISMHFYQNENKEILNHEAVLKESAYIKSAADFLSNRDPPIPLALAETAVALGDGDGEPLSSALVGVDFMLHMMSIGVSRINYQSGLNFGFSLWDIDYPSLNITAQVRPIFYSQVFAADFLGPSGHTQVSEINTGSSNLTAYGAYDDGKLERIAFTSYSPVSTPGRNISLDLGKSSGVKEATIQTLKKSVDSNKQSQITWGGMTWSAENQGVGKQVANDSRTIQVKNGILNVQVAGREAVMATLRY